MTKDTVILGLIAVFLWTYLGKMRADDKAKAQHEAFERTISEHMIFVPDAGWHFR